MLLPRLGAVAEEGLHNVWQVMVPPGAVNLELVVAELGVATRIICICIDVGFRFIGRPREPIAATGHTQRVQPPPLMSLTLAQSRRVVTPGRNTMPCKLVMLPMFSTATGMGISQQLGFWSAHRNEALISPVPGRHRTYVCLP